MGVHLVKIKTAYRNQVKNEPFFGSILIIPGIMFTPSYVSTHSKE